MSDILSQDEVNALLKGVKEGEIETSPEEAPQEVRPFDLADPERAVRSVMPEIEKLTGRFAVLFSGGISRFLGRFMKVTVEGTSLMKFGEFTKVIPLPASINVFKVNPLKGHALMVLEAPLVFAMVEYFFGGDGAGQVKTEVRGFTAVEQRLINKVLTIALDGLREALEGLVKVEAERVASETNPEFVTVVPREETFIRVECHVEMDNQTEKFFLGIPCSLLDIVKEKAGAGTSVEKEEMDGEWVRMLTERLSESAVNISVELDRTELTLQDVLNLRKGDIITLGKASSDELLLKVEGIPKFYCTPGYHRGSQAVKVTRPIESSHERSG